jgi:ribose transport system permease protein
MKPSLRTLWARLRNSRFAAVLVLLVVIWVYFSLSQDRFLTSANIQAMLAGASILWFVALGLTFVMLAGAYDLSLGSQLALSGMAFGAFYLSLGLPLLVALGLTVAFGAVVGGGVNGFLVGRLGMPFLVVTLGTLTLYRGIVDLWSGGDTRQVESSALDAAAFDKLLGIPLTVWLMAAALAISAYVLRSTYFGRDVYAVGGSAPAARLSGIRVARTLALVYAVAGAMAAVAGILQVARVGAVSPVVGGNVIFDATAAVVLGGASFTGGVGSVGGTGVAVIFLATLQNGLAVAGLQSAWQQVISGGILIVALFVDVMRNGGWHAFRHKMALRFR